MLFIPYGPVALMEQAFEHGCSDYLREPWALPELRARGLHLLTLKFLAGECKLELKGTRLAGETASIELTESERALLRLLVLNAPLPVPRQAAVSVLSSHGNKGSHSLGRCVVSLRRKMESVEPGFGGRLLAIRAFGYRLDASSCV
jgi:DNA-binding response OmpR family regulator